MEQGFYSPEIKRGSIDEVFAVASGEYGFAQTQFDYSSIGLGEVPVTPEFAMLSTDEVPKSIEPYLPGHNALLLANHGALAWGESLWQAFDRMETVEHTAKTLLNVQALGGGVPLTEAQVDTLIGMRDMYKSLCGKTK